MINLLCIKKVEDQPAEEQIEAGRNAGKASESAALFKSIQGVNRELKQAMMAEMKRRGLSDDVIPDVFRTGNDKPRQSF